MTTVDQFAVTSGTIPASGTFAVTHADITTWSTKGICVFEISGAKTDDSQTDDMRISWGVVDHSGNAGCFAGRLEDAVGLAATSHYFSTTASGFVGAMIDAASTTVNLKVAFSSAGTGGPTLSVSTGTETGFVYKAWLFATSGSGDCIAFAMGTGDFTGASAAMDVYAMVIGQGTNDTVSTHHRLGFGAVLGDLTQRCVGFTVPRVVPISGGTAATLKLRNDRAGSYNTSSEDTLQVTAINSNGFSATDSGTGNIEKVGFGIKLGDDDRSVNLVIEDIADELGGPDEEVSFTELGFTPVSVLTASTLADAEDSDITDAKAGAMALGMFTATDEGAVGVRSSVGETSTTDTGSVAGAASAIGWKDDGTVGYWGTFSQMVSSGFELTFTQSPPGGLTASPEPGKMLVLGFSGISPLQQVDEAEGIAEAVSWHRGKIRQVDEAEGIAESVAYFVVEVFRDLTKTGRVARAGGELGNVALMEAEEGDQEEMAVLGRVSIAGGLLGNVAGQGVGDDEDIEGD